MVSDILTDPNEFFRERVDNPGILLPFGIVAAVAIIAAIGALPKAELAGQVASDAVQAQGEQMNESTADAIGAFSTGFSVVVSFVFVLLTWLVYGVVFYLIAHFAFGGSGSLRDTLAFTGWGYVPLLINQLSGAAAAYYVFAGVSLPEANEAAQDTFRELQNDPVLLASGVLGLVLLAWSGVIWTAAMRQLHDISRRNAVITVGIPVGIAFLVRIVGLL